MSNLTTLHAKQEVKACDISYITFAAVTMTSALSTSQILKGKEHNFTPINLINIVNGSIPIKESDKVKAFKVQARVLTKYDVTSI